MQYIISFLEGIITFLSPCLLPMIPVYLTYFAGGGVRSTSRTLLGACGFVLGFTVMFTAMGALAGTLGSLLTRYSFWLNLIGGLIVIFFGLNYIGFFQLNLFKGIRSGMQPGNLRFGSAFLFGVVFSVGWTPCVGAFLGSALMLASQQATMVQGMGMLLCYSLGLGIPFLFSAVLIDKLKSAFGWIKSHYDVINLISGSLLVLFGILMATGMLGRWLAVLS